MRVFYHWLEGVKYPDGGNFWKPRTHAIKAGRIPQMLNGIQHYPRTFLDMLEISCLLILAKSRQDSSNVNWNPALYLDKLEVSYLLFLAQSRQDSSNVIWNPAFS